jgi:hypothetical protein
MVGAIAKRHPASACIMGPDAEEPALERTQADQKKRAGAIAPARLDSVSQRLFFLEYLGYGEFGHCVTHSGNTSKNHCRKLLCYIPDDFDSFAALLFAKLA